VGLKQLITTNWFHHRFQRLTPSFTMCEMNIYLPVCLALALSFFIRSILSIFFFLSIFICVAGICLSLSLFLSISAYVYLRLHMYGTLRFSSVSGLCNLFRSLSCLFIHQV
jgi:hypothetical protein